MGKYSRKGRIMLLLSFLTVTSRRKGGSHLYAKLENFENLNADDYFVSRS